MTDRCSTGPGPSGRVPTGCGPTLRGVRHGAPEPTETGPVGVSSAFGTFGELLQGVLPGADGDFLVTLPVARWSTARFHATPGSGELIVWPPHKTKALRLTEMVLRDEGVPAQGLLLLDSTLPEGKGLASSSADLVATARAVGNALGVPLSRPRIESYLARIEPTDGVLYPGIVAYRHRSVRLLARLGSLPSMAVVAVDEGGAVDTVDLNRIPKPFTAADRCEYASLLDRLSAAVAARDLREVGRVSTRSARMNQILQHKRHLDAMVAVAGEVGGLGVVAGHSGTTLGVLLDSGDAAFAHRLTATAQACERLAGNVTVYHSLSFD